MEENKYENALVDAANLILKNCKRWMDTPQLLNVNVSIDVSPDCEPTMDVTLTLDL